MRSRIRLRVAAGALIVLGLLAVAGAAARSAEAFKPTAEFGHVGITEDGMKDITRTSPDGSKTYSFSDRAIKEVRDAVAGVDEIFSDRGEFGDPVAHCDNELLPECTQRLIDLKNAAVAALVVLTSKVSDERCKDDDHDRGRRDDDDCDDRDRKLEAKVRFVRYETAAGPATSSSATTRSRSGGTPRGAARSRSSSSRWRPIAPTARSRPRTTRRRTRRRSSRSTRATGS
jgi:hypothetical protein